MLRPSRLARQHHYRHRHHRSDGIARGGRSSRRVAELSLYRLACEPLFSVQPWLPDPCDGDYPRRAGSLSIPAGVRKVIENQRKYRSALAAPVLPRMSVEIPIFFEFTPRIGRGEMQRAPDGAPPAAQHAGSNSMSCRPGRTGEWWQCLLDSQASRRRSAITGSLARSRQPQARLTARPCSTFNSPEGMVSALASTGAVKRGFKLGRNRAPTPSLSLLDEPPATGRERC